MRFGTVCPACSHTMPSLESQAELYFEGKEIRCYNADCKVPVDYWAATHKLLGEELATSVGLLLLGAMHSEFSFELEPDESFKLDLSNHGIPSNATVLTLDLHTQDADPNCYPQMLAHELPVSLKSKFAVYGIPLKDSQGKSTMSAEVTWVRNDDETFSWSHLVEAFQALASEQYRSVILPAYMALELTLTPLVRNSLKKFISSAAATSWVEQQPSSSLHLNVMLPLLADRVNAKQMPVEIRGKINALRGLRNNIVHEGVSPASITKDQAQQFVCASIFGLEYLRYLHKRIFETNQDQGNANPV
jgi:hypothetical protein